VVRRYEETKWVWVIPHHKFQQMLIVVLLIVPNQVSITICNPGTTL
jgi:hypothetical protein